LLLVLLATLVVLGAASLIVSVPVARRVHEWQQVRKARRAIAVLEEWGRDDPGKWRALTGLYMATGEWDRAVDAGKASVELAPGEPLAWQLAIQVDLRLMEDPSLSYQALGAPSRLAAAGDSLLVLAQECARSGNAADASTALTFVLMAYLAAGEKSRLRRACGEAVAIAAQLRASEYPPAAAEGARMEQFLARFMEVHHILGDPQSSDGEDRGPQTE
jgi:hypothetical protein